MVRRDVLGSCTLAIVLVLATAGTFAATPKAKWLKLELDQEKNSCMIRVDLKSPEIWIGKRPYKVKWEVPNRDPRHHWIIEKVGGPGEFQGNEKKFALTCDQPHKKVMFSPKGSAEGVWEYTVKVLDCDGGTVCDDFDPEIHIRKRP